MIIMNTLLIRSKHLLCIRYSQVGYLFFDVSISLSVPRSPPRAIGTVFSDSLGIRHLAMLREPLKSQILLAAGAIGSPHFLMLSGVGDVDILEPYRVPVVLNSSSVGKGMTDNPANSMYVPSRIPVEISLMQTVGITDFGGFIETSSGIRAVLFQ